MARTSPSYARMVGIALPVLLVTLMLAGCRAVAPEADLEESLAASAQAVVNPVNLPPPPQQTGLALPAAAILPTATPAPTDPAVAESAAAVESAAAESAAEEAASVQLPTATPVAESSDEAFAPIEGQSEDADNQRASAGTNLASGRYYAVVMPFDTVQDDIALEELRAQWQGEATLYTSADGRDLLPALLGDASDNVSVVAPEELIALLEADRTALGVIPFEQIDPRFKVLTVDGVNPLSNQLAEGDYALVVEGAPGNREASKLTTLVMTGVTAISRGTAAAIVRAGSTSYPAEIIGPELALADITHVSNEIPFIEGCIVNNTLNNLILCSDPSYWDALELMGTDIVGLSGNHVNDFGRDGARESLAWYKENNIPIYGSGLTVDEACAPLLWEHNGNTFAFIAALAYGPESAWVTAEEPGACYYYEHKDRILATIALLTQAVDIVAVELQYEEIYFASPSSRQVEEFRELRAVGADLVTGVQSHVPQAQEPYGAFDEGGHGFISYGLGNLFFDQMWSWETRTELYARHAIYDGKLISTEILTGVLEDFAQPRWTTADERADLLNTIFNAVPSRP